MCVCVCTCGLSFSSFAATQCVAYLFLLFCLMMMCDACHRIGSFSLLFSTPQECLGVFSGRIKSFCRLVDPTSEDKKRVVFLTLTDLHSVPFSSAGFSLKQFFSTFFAPISFPQFSSPFSSDEEIFSLMYDLSGSGPTRLHHYTSSPLEQVVPPLEVAPLPVWQPVEVLPGHPEDHVELGVRQVLLQVAAVHVARKAVVGSEQQVQRVDVGGLFSDTFFKSFVGNE